MRIVAAVVVGIVLLSFGHVVRAAEAPRKRSEVCLDGCNFAFEKCQAKAGPKGDGRCNITVVRCKQDCPFETVEAPAVPTEKSHTSCVETCRTVYKKCRDLPENRQGGNCQAEDMRCEKACPKPPEEPEVAAVPEAPRAPGDTSPPAPVAPRKPPAKPKRATRVEGASAPAPIIPTPTPIVVRPTPVVNERADQPPTVRSEAVTPPAAAPAQANPAAARPAQSERGFFGKLGCFFHSCEPAGSTPCLDQCAGSYDQCRVQESKRGGECNTRLMRCRQGCRDAGALSTPP